MFDASESLLSSVLLIILAVLSTEAAGQTSDLNAQSAADQTDRPNIIFLFTDDHANAAISSYGSVINQTPQIDRIASQGMLFERALCTNSICAPSRAVILTGKHSHINGVIDNRVQFDGSQQTFPKLLQQAGYRTAMIGKWHLKSDPTGFDYWEVLPGQGQYYNPVFRTAEGSRQYEGYNTDITTDLALKWLEEQRDADGPFLLMCQYKAPHRNWMPGPGYLDLYEGQTIPEPATLFDDYSTRGTAAHEQEMTIRDHMIPGYDLKCPPAPEDRSQLDDPGWWANLGILTRLTPSQLEKWMAAYRSRNEAFYEMQPEGDDLVRWKYQRYIKDYLRCIASVDDNIGRLLDYLDQNDLSNNTIVIYSSDQGFYLGEHGWFDKRFMYEPSLRMPFIVSWPGVTKPGSRNRDLVQNLDFAETLLDMAGVAIPEDMQGRSLVPILNGRTPADWRDSIYYEYFEKGVHNVSPHRGVRTDRYKLIHFHELDEWEFYDLKEDPSELHNRYGDPAYAEVIDDLRAELARLMIKYKVPADPPTQ